MTEKQNEKAEIRQARLEALKQNLELERARDLEERQDLFHRTDEELADSLIDNFKEENIDELSVPHAAESRGGLGDVIEKVMNKMGVTHERMEKIFGVDSEGCGCGKRKKFLNSLWPYYKEHKENKEEE